MSRPWVQIKTVDNEEKTKNFTFKEKKCKQKKKSKKYSKDKDTKMKNNTSNDAVIAKMLQDEFNHEYDLMLKLTEEKLNGKSKVKISLSNFRICSDDVHKNQMITNGESRDIDKFVKIQKEYASIPRCGYKKNGEGSKIVTKHDIQMSSKINACRVLDFPPGIETGDTGNFDMKLNNKVFNSLRAHSHAVCAREKAKGRSQKK